MPIIYWEKPCSECIIMRTSMVFFFPFYALKNIFKVNDSDVSVFLHMEQHLEISLVILLNIFTPVLPTVCGSRQYSDKGNYKLVQ